MESCPNCDRSFKNSNALNAHSKYCKPKSDNYFPDIEIPEWKDTPGRGDDSGIVGNEWLPVHPQIDTEAYAPIIVKVKKLPHGEDLPDLARATPGSAAFDLYAAIDKPVCIGVNERLPIPVGIEIELPLGYAAKIYPRSGMGFKHGISIVNTPGLIDEDFRNEIQICLINHSRKQYWVNRGDRIAQMLIERVIPVEFEYVDELSITDRIGGFGSTGMR
jgi:dUTP pyrophosphatase